LHFYSTYDVIWVKNYDLHWASRWDVYLSMDNAVPAKVHWYSIVDSLAVVIIAGGWVLTVLIRNLRALNNQEGGNGSTEDTGWKALHADVFRPPATSPVLLAVACGTGAQLLATTLVSILFASMGFMSPARRGSFLIGSILIFAIMGIVSGYVSARFFKMFKGQDWNLEWKRVTFLAAAGFPGISFSVFLLVNTLSFFLQSTAAVPFATIVVLMVLWSCICMPLAFIGAFFGYRREIAPFPVETALRCRPIPPRSWRPLVKAAAGTIAVFASLYVELFFIMSSVWYYYYYYVFGSLLVVSLLAIATCAEFSVLCTHRQLVSEDYRWWWQSFLGSGSLAVWVFLYSCAYFRTLEASHMVTYVIYFGYMALVSLAFFLVAGYIGITASLWFNRLLYGWFRKKSDDVEDNEMGLLRKGQNFRLDDLVGASASSWPTDKIFASGTRSSQVGGGRYHEIPGDLQLRETDADTTSNALAGSIYLAGTLRP
jgi:transmembrane 9 superfamily protein 2/4